MPTAIRFLRSFSPSLRPDPQSLEDGMPMVNLDQTDPGLYFALKDSSLMKVGPTHVGDTAPNSSAQGFAGNTIGETWLDTSSSSNLFKVYDGSNWITALGGGGGVTPGIYLPLTGGTMTGNIDFAAVQDKATNSRIAPVTLNDSLTSPTLDQSAGVAATPKAVYEAVSYTYPSGSQRVVQDRLTDRVSVKDFGAVGDGVTDDTAAIQAAVDAVKGNIPGLLYFPKGSYKLSIAGNINQSPYQTSDYAIFIDEPIHIDATEAYFPVDIADTAVKHSFVFSQVSSGSFTGGKFVGENLTGTSRLLFKGCAVAVYASENVTVSNLICENLKASAHLYSSNNCVIKDSLGYRVNQTIQSGTFFGCYSGSFNVISGCSVYGGCEDGDIYAYGTGYGNKILYCKAFNSLYGDDTYALLDGNNQGLGLDAAQDSGTVSGCTAYGHYYGIDTKGATGENTLSDNLLVRNKVGIAVRAGEVGADVIGHALVCNNVVLPLDGNGNTNNLFGYITTGIELTRCPSVTIDGNYIGVGKPSFFNNPAIPVDVDFASIVYVNDAASITDPLQPSDVIISNNRIQHSLLFAGLQQRSTGPLIFAIAFYTGATNNIGAGVNFTIQGNTFTPNALGDYDRIIEINGISSVTYSGNTHTGIVSTDLKDIPFVYTNKVPTMTATANTFERQGIAFKHVYPAIDDMPSDQFMFGFNASGNILGRGLTQAAAPAVIQVEGNGPCLVTGNSYWRVRNFSPDPSNPNVPNEGQLLSYTYTNAVAPGLNLTNNMMNGPQNAGSYYSVNGVNAATGTNLVIANNIVVNQ